MVGCTQQPPPATREQWQQLSLNHQEQQEEEHEEEQHEEEHHQQQQEENQPQAVWSRQARADVFIANMTLRSSKTLGLCSRGKAGEGYSFHARNVKIERAMTHGVGRLKFYFFFIFFAPFLHPFSSCNHVFRTY